ncbi:uncharacterized protein I206_100797 [Kwoniella pini CBS 10737]|uniref:C2H2-type domain-containing protein n=1 Tax=Kwoniella pini CBS 10737 TaxID=1296096 RepID=A0A1B9IC89_9TREE|nr:uncharacterized protein I206_00530 [Kwoniella pini CBS 10737]OCF53229.1 hypothetical protein I206_00530 [Kwoniella pini CBS 10737]
MIIEITLLLLLILIEAPLNDKEMKCDCTCKCGKKNYIPSKYPLVFQEDDLNVKEKQDEENNNIVKDFDSEEPEYVGQGYEQEWEEVNRGSNPQPSYGRKLRSHKPLVLSGGSLSRYEKGRDHSNRPKPPHLDRPVPDKQSFVLGRQKKRNRDDLWCDHCQRSLVDLVALQQHNFALHPKVPIMSRSRYDIQQARSVTPIFDFSAYICEVCQEEFITSNSLYQHKAMQHPWAVFCSDCLTDFDNATDAQDHYHFIHNTEWKKPRQIQHILDTIKGSPDRGHATAHLPANQSHGRSVALDRPLVFPTHTIQTYYNCNECKMVFGDPKELERHKATPLMHGCRIYQEEDFPPLGAEFNEITKKSTSQVNAISEEFDRSHPNNWSMPNYTMDEKEPATIEKVWTPQARLSPETVPPDDGSSESLFSLENTIQQGAAFKTYNSNDTTGPMAVKDFDMQDSHRNAFIANESGVMQPVDQLPQNSSPRPTPVDTEALNEFALLQNNAETPEARASRRDAITTDDERNIGHITTLTDPKESKVSTDLEIITSKHVSQTVPNNIQLIPYARAALASASRITEYPPADGSSAVTSDVYELSPELQPKVIGGIECHVPSFFFSTTPSISPSSEALSEALSHTSTSELTLSGTSNSSSMSNSLIIQDGQDDTAQEVIEFAHSEIRQNISLDLGSIENGNRPKVKTRALTARQARLLRQSNNGRKETFVTPAQRELYARRDKEKKQIKAPLQPIFDSEWSRIELSPTVGLTGGQGGRIIKESAWDRGIRETEERNMMIAAGRGEVDYGGW